MSFQLTTAGKACAVGLVLGLGAGIGIGWGLSAPKVAEPEEVAPAQRQGDGSLILERKPDADAKPKQEIPKGATVQRIIQLTVTPAQPAKDMGMQPERIQKICPPVRVDLTLVKMPDGGQRVIASSPDGEIGGVDIPVARPEPQPKPINWSGMGLVGYDFRQNKRVYGGAISYQSGPFVGMSGVIGETVFVGVGVRW